MSFTMEVEEGWMTGSSARYDTNLIQSNGNGTNNKSVTSDDDSAAILGIESVYNDESHDGIASNHSGQNRRASKVRIPSPAPSADNDASDAGEEDVMWKCAKCPLEFSDRESVIAHVRAVHKKIHPAQAQPEPEPLDNDDPEDDAEVAEYEIEYVNDNDINDDEDYRNDFDNEMPTWSPGQAGQPSPIIPESPKSRSSTSSRGRKTRGNVSNTTNNSSSTSKGKGRPRKRNAPKSYDDYSPLSNHLSDDDYEVSPVRSTAKKPKPWATPSICCNICFLQVSTSDALKRHMDTFYFRPRIWKCTSCPLLFMGKAESDAHFETQHPEDTDEIVTSWNCDSCDRVFEDEYDLAHHETFHGVKAPWGCRCCGRTFERPTLLRTHENAEVNKFHGGGYKCVGCSEAFLTATELRSHQRNACSNPSALKCENCDKEFNTFDGLQKHRITHTIELPWNCVKCGERFQEKGELSVHLKEEHGEDITSACNTCGKTFGRAAALRQHELICQKYIQPDDDDDEEEEREDPLDTNFDVDEAELESPKPQKKSKARTSTPAKTSSSSSKKQQYLDCSYCSESFTRQNALEAHEVKKHAVTRKYGCRQCPQRFVGPAQLKQHVLTVHVAPNGSIYKCSICAKLFSKKEYLQIHSRVHIGERRFKCTQLDCAQVFYTPQARTQHLLAIHGLTEQVFKCKDCGKEFEKQRELERHEITHDKETPSSSTVVTEGKFKCVQCGKSFLEQFLLTMHQKEHEQTEYQCEHCDKKFKNLAQRNMHTKKSHADTVSRAVEEIVLD